MEQEDLNMAWPLHMFKRPEKSKQQEVSTLTELGCPHNDPLLSDFPIQIRLQSVDDSMKFAALYITSCGEHVLLWNSWTQKFFIIEVPSDTPLGEIIENIQQQDPIQVCFSEMTEL